MERRSPRLPVLIRTWYIDWEARVATVIAQHAVDILRVAIGVVFVWFGALKVVGRSPAAELVTQTIGVDHVGHASVVRMLGVLETGIGFGLLFGVALRTTLVLFMVQQVGTFLVLIVVPELAFQHQNPFLLTMTGEFVIKNLVLVASGLAVLAHCTPISAVRTSLTNQSQSPALSTRDSRPLAGTVSVATRGSA